MKANSSDTNYSNLESGFLATEVKKGDKMGIVKECYNILDWMEKEARLQFHHPIYSKMKTIKTTLEGIDSQIHGVDKNG